MKGTVDFGNQKVVPIVPQQYAVTKVMLDYLESK
jgi:hypothetical protein